MSKIVRANKKKESFVGKFYVLDCTTEQRGEWWTLRLVHNHYTLIAVESKEKLFSCLKNVVLKYKDFNKLLKVLKKCERERHSKESFEKMAKEYKEYRHSDLEEEVNDFILEVEEGVVSTKHKKIQPIKKVEEVAKKKEPIKKKSTPVVKRHKKKKKIRIHA